MSKNHLTVAIAIICGIDIDLFRSKDGDINVAALPQYASDHNAMYQAKLTMVERQIRKLYARQLMIGVLGNWYTSINSEDAVKISLATAEQQAIAFAQAHGVWTP